MATLLIGYDVEVSEGEHREKTQTFLRVAPRLHHELNAPCTFFVVGKTLELNLSQFLKIKESYPEIDFQQHTYSHLLLKTVAMDDGEKVTVYRGGSLKEIREDVAKASVLLRQRLGVECIGLTGPYGYYRGLSDRPDILEILHEIGIRFTRTYARNEADYQPVAWEVQPFWYEPQGFPDMLEFPIQGWQDCYLRVKFGYANLDRYFEEIRRGIDYIVAHNLVWCYAQHDWTSIREDPEMWLTRRIIEYAQSNGV